MSNFFTAQQGGEPWIGVKDPAPVAKRVEPGKPFALLYGPDAILKVAATAYRAIHPDHELNIRTTDQPLANADDTPCDIRIIIQSDRSAQWMALWQSHGMTFVVATWGPEGLRFIHGGTAAAPPVKPHVIEAEKPELPGSVFTPPVGSLVLQNGTQVDYGQAFLRGAANLGISPEVLSAMDVQTQMEVIHAAYDLLYDRAHPVEPVAPAAAVAPPSEAMRAKVRELTTPPTAKRSHKKGKGGKPPPAKGTSG